MPRQPQIAGRQRRRPVVGVNDVGPPVRIRDAAGKVGSGERQTGEADIVIPEIPASGVEVGATVPIVEFRTDDHVDDQTILRLKPCELRGRDGGMGGKTPDRDKTLRLREDLPVAGNENPDVVMPRQCARERTGDVAEAADLDEIGHLGRREQDPLSERPGRRGGHTEGTGSRHWHLARRCERDCCSCGFPCCRCELRLP